MAKPIVVTDADFEEKVLRADKPVVVDFWAPWCAPCRAIAPILDKLATEYEGRLTIAKVNTDEEIQHASALGIQGIPTLIIFKNGQEVGRLVGSRSERPVPVWAGDVAPERGSLRDCPAETKSRGEMQARADTYRRLPLHSTP